jgi:hypothetical protein
VISSAYQGASGRKEGRVVEVVRAGTKVGAEASKQAALGNRRKPSRRKWLRASIERRDSTLLHSRNQHFSYFLTSHILCHDCVAHHNDRPC